MSLKSSLSVKFYKLKLGRVLLYFLFFCALVSWIHFSKLSSSSFSRVLCELELPGISFWSLYSKRSLGGIIPRGGLAFLDAAFELRVELYREADGVLKMMHQQIFILEKNTPSRLSIAASLPLFALLPSFSPFLAFVLTPGESRRSTLFLHQWSSPWD